MAPVPLQTLPAPGQGPPPPDHLVRVATQRPLLHQSSHASSLQASLVPAHRGGRDTHLSPGTFLGAYCVQRTALHALM